MTTNVGEKDRLYRAIAGVIMASGFGKADSPRRGRPD